MRKFTQLAYHERDKIYIGLCKQKTVTEIAKELERHKSTISREIKRNCDKIGYLYPGKAHEAALDRRNKNVSKIDKNKKLRKYIIFHLKERWSPNAIAGRWNLESLTIKVSAESIYRWIYKQKPFYDGGILIDLRKCLVRARKRRGLKRKIPQSKIKERVSVHERPDHINKRVEVGHYEGDLIFNKDSQSKNILTLVERVTRQTILIKNDNKRSNTVIDGFIDYINRTGTIIKSITFDNGSEFTDHTKLNAIGIKTYFCDPGSPWQKGSIENLNGVVRRFIPFSMSAFTLTKKLVEEVASKMNLMPRKILGFKTPLEASVDINQCNLYAQ